MKLIIIIAIITFILLQVGTVVGFEKKKVVLFFRPRTDFTDTQRNRTIIVLYLFRLDAGLLAISQYSEVPATGHLDTGFSWFPCI